MEDDLPLLVSVNALSDYLYCSICMNVMKETVMTSCGHRYCSRCIKEWVDRNHKCPCCNKAVTMTEVFKDHQFDCLIDAINQEKTKSEAKYFESLINSAVSESHTTTTLSPIETVLKDHLKESLASHERYFQKLRNELNDQERRLEVACENTITDLASHGLSQEELTQQTTDLQNRLSHQKEALQDEMESCTKLVAESYNRYLTSHLPKLDVIPVKVGITILDKNMKVSDVVFKPADRIGDKVKASVEATMAARSDPVGEWPEELHFVLFGPFVKCSHFEMQQMVREILHDGKVYQDVKVLDRQSRPVLEHSMKPGSEIAIYGKIILESDMPKKCFQQVFEEGNPQSVDYFCCKQCAFQWICRSCMEVCHQGHETVPYIMNHQPAWACCYCPKKKTCLIQPPPGTR
ncbi:E3 ubiquitin-protein ligase TRIM62-like [Mizuhopecten yessoensis]|uniref:E3 ubiquitin-protein ligase TRIM62-like n=1 Tax=Mizuhopecten yessoensis TaxID=6573 RepID=UPI000B45B3A0|nr:E3 ubiquitin-protein ligase TRIM62-like [Mizuhopecten yessoensis]